MVKNETDKKNTWIVIGVLLFAVLFLAPSMFSVAGQTLSPSQVDGSYPGGCMVEPSYANDTLSMTPVGCTLANPADPSIEFFPTYTIFEGDWVVNTDGNIYLPASVDQNPADWCASSGSLQYRTTTDVIVICPDRPVLGTVSFNAQELSGSTVKTVSIPTLTEDTTLVICMNNPWSGYGAMTCYKGTSVLLIAELPVCVEDSDCIQYDDEGMPMVGVISTCVNNTCEYSPLTAPECLPDETKLTPVEHCGKTMNILMECEVGSWVLPPLVDCGTPELECTTSAECADNYDCVEGTCVFAPTEYNVTAPEDLGVDFTEKQEEEVEEIPINNALIGLGALIIVIAGWFKYGNRKTD